MGYLHNMINLCVSVKENKFWTPLSTNLCGQHMLQSYLFIYLFLEKGKGGRKRGKETSM